MNRGQGEGVGVRREGEEGWWRPGEGEAGGGWGRWGRGGGEHG